jgi:hypothetical protein
MEPMSRSTLLALKSDEDAKYRRETISHAVTAIYSAVVLMAKQTHTTVYKRRIDDKRIIPEIVEELKKLFPDSVVKKTRRGYIKGQVYEGEELDLDGDDYISVDWS